MDNRRAMVRQLEYELNYSLEKIQKMQALLERTLHEFRGGSSTMESAMTLADDIETLLKEAKEVKHGQ